MNTGLGLRNNDIVYTPIAISASGDNSVLAADASTPTRKHRLLGFCLVAAAGVSLTIKTGLAGSATARTGAMPMIAGTPFVMPGSLVGCLETKNGEALNFSLSGAVAVGGFMMTIPV